VNNLTDPTTILTEDAIAVIAKSIEWAIFYGDADLSADKSDQSGVELDGLHTSARVRVGARSSMT
ncbi:hypothetical protein, partial [Escherichia coli]|uniref:hypothetical protein n=1 Tax=Escherichia coli TaxID=562 RepID=UPI003DA6EF62